MPSASKPGAMAPCGCPKAAAATCSSIPRGSSPTPKARRRDRHRQHLRPRPDGDGERPARRSPNSRTGVSCSVSACRTADGRGAARPYLRQAGDDDARLSASDAQAPYRAPPPRGTAADVVAALGPRMMALSGELATERIPTTAARAHRGGPPDPRLRQIALPRSVGVAGDRPRQRRAAARQALSHYMRLENYVNNWRRTASPTTTWRRRLRPLYRRQCRMGHRASDPRPHPGALGRRRRPCLHPTDQPPWARRPTKSVLGLLAPGSRLGARLDPAGSQPTLCGPVSTAVSPERRRHRRARTLGHVFGNHPIDQHHGQAILSGAALLARRKPLRVGLSRPDREPRQRNRPAAPPALADHRRPRQVQEVRGPGVVGEQPVLGPGESFEYTSGTPLPTPSGIMVGSYEMETRAGESFSVRIPAFSLDSPHQPVRLN